MSSRDYQIKLLLTAINNASPVVKQMIKDMKKVEEVEKKQRAEKVAYTKFWKTELDKRSRDAEQHNKRIKQTNKELEFQTNRKRKSEIEYTSFWNKELDKRDKIADRISRQERLRQNQAFRQQQNTQRNERRLRLQRYTDLSHAQESARAAMLYVSTPATANAAFAIKNAMTMEQMGIRMRTQFGREEGNMALEEMKNYAAQTAFRLQEAVQLLSGMKVGQKGLGITNTKDLVAKSKSIGNVLLAYSYSPEGRAEIAYQLSQVAMKRKANMRQDLMVMANYGLPIFEMMEKYTGKTLEELKKIYGAELPADLIFKVLDMAAKSPAVLQAMTDKSDSLSQSWDTFTERVFFTSSTYGEVLDKQLGIKDAIKGTSTILQKMEAQMKGLESGSLTTKEQVIGFTTAMAIGIPTLTFAALTFKKLFGYASQTAGSTLALSRTMSLAGAAISGAYLTTLNWDEIIKDIDKNGLKGLLNHMDALISAATIFSSIMMFAFPGGFLLKGAGKLGGLLMRTILGKSIGAATIAGGAYFGGRELRSQFDSYLERLRAEELVNNIANSTPQMTPIPNSSQAGLKTAFDVASKPQWSTPEQSINLNIENNLTIDENGNLKSQTKVKRSPMDKPYVSEAWQ